MLSKKSAIWAPGKWVDGILQQRNLLWDPAKIKAENCVSYAKRAG